MGFGVCTRSLGSEVKESVPEGQEQGRRGDSKEFP